MLNPTANGERSDDIQARVPKKKKKKKKKISKKKKKKKKKIYRIQVFHCPTLHLRNYLMTHEKHFNYKK